MKKKIVAIVPKSHIPFRVCETAFYLKHGLILALFLLLSVSNDLYAVVVLSISLLGKTFRFSEDKRK